MPADWCRRDGPDLVLTIAAQPRGGPTAFAGIHGGAVKLRLGAPPVDGRANEELVRFLASAFGVPRRQVTLLRGAGGRRKTVRIGRPTRYPPELPPLR